MLLRALACATLVAAATAFGPAPTQLPGADAKVRGERGREFFPIAPAGRAPLAAVSRRLATFAQPHAARHA